eukprot:4385017-Prymnesium_polylepis.1
MVHRVWIPTRLACMKIEAPLAPRPRDALAWKDWPHAHGACDGFAVVGHPRTWQVHVPFALKDSIDNAKLLRRRNSRRFGFQPLKLNRSQRVQ